MVMTREELQAEIEADEAKTDAEQEENVLTDELETETPQESEEETEVNKADEDTEKSEEGGEPDTEEAEKAEVEDWLKGDDHTSQAEKKFTDGDIGKAKAKLKAKVKQKDSEIDLLRAEIDALKQPRIVQKPSELQKPKREDFYENENPDDAYDSALTDYIVSKTQATQAAANATTDAQRAQQETQQQVSQGEDDHYERAAKLIVKSKIAPERYQAADLAFKQAIEDVIPDAGDNVSALFVSMLGEGSEKVVYNIGNNSGKREKFSALLREDPTGLKAGMFLAALNTELSSPNKRKSNAPKPAPELKGDAIVNTLTKQLKEAEKSGSVQAQVDLRKKIRMSSNGA